MAFARAADIRARGRTLTESIIKTASRYDAAKDVFISHSHLDGDLVNGAYDVLRKHGATPYLAVRDDDLLSVENHVETASILREHIVGCGRLVLLMTDHGASSGWTPWELGIADGLHGREHVAVFPLLEDPRAGEAWATREYLGTYPSIQLVTFEGEVQREYGVHDPIDGEWCRLRRWLTR